MKPFTNPAAPLLAIVLFSACLFLAGLCTRLRSVRLQASVLALGCIVFVCTVAWGRPSRSPSPFERLAARGDHGLGRLDRLVELLFDQLEARVPEAGVGEVDADDPAELFG